MRIVSVLAIGALSASASASVFTDATADLFDNSLSNLDIASVEMNDNGVDLTISITTASYQNWTKYMIMFNTVAGGATSNAWSRPIDLAGTDIDYFIGSWVDAPSSNSQFVAYETGAWNWGAASTFTNSVSGNTVSWTVSLASLGLSAGQTMWFDVATSGGGNDPGVDHLSRSDMATTGWGTPSVAGAFASYTVTPAPGAIALLGLVGLAARRRR